MVPEVPTARLLLTEEFFESRPEIWVERVQFGPFHSGQEVFAPYGEGPA